MRRTRFKSWHWIPKITWYNHTYITYENVWKKELVIRIRWGYWSWI